MMVGLRRQGLLVAVLVGLFCLPARAEMVEVAPGVSVTKKTYRVQLNEAPFFNFTAKNAKQREADEKLLAFALSKVPDRATAARIASSRGWDYIKQGDFATAAKRFNQAYLLDPMDSALYHGFAVVVFERFRDVDYAVELLRVAAGMNSPLDGLSADHGRVLLKAGRPADAIPLLKRGMLEAPESIWPVVDLARALLETGDSDGACRIVVKATQSHDSQMKGYIAELRRRAKCR